MLPQNLRRPKAVLLDVESGNLLYILDGNDLSPQLAMALDFLIKGRKDDPVNVVVSAYKAQMNDLLGRLKHGRLIVLSGSLR